MQSRKKSAQRNGWLSLGLVLSLVALSLIELGSLPSARLWRPATRAQEAATGRTQRLDSPDAVPDGLSHSDWSSIRTAYEKQRHAAFAVEGGYQARNHGQRWLTRFDGSGFAVTPDGDAWQWGLELQSYGFGERQHAITRQARVEAEGQRVAYGWDAALEEWFVNDQRGLEHGFTLKERPTVEANGAGPLELRLAVRGELRPQVQAGGQGVSFVNMQGSTVLNYAGLKVWDADGQMLSARFEPMVEGLRLVVEEREARYPLTIDPTVQQAYLKASNTGANDHFGLAVAVAGDTVVVGAKFEDSNATGVNGNQSDNSASSAGAAYVFVRSDGTWSQQAYLKASNTDDANAFGSSVAISNDTIVIGAPGEESSATGVNGDQNNNNAEGAGAAYVFVRSGATWSQQAYLKASNTDVGDDFGRSVAISNDTIVIGAAAERSNATGVNGNQNDDSVLWSGAAYVFVRNAGTWSQQAYLKASNTGAGDFFGQAVAISGDTIVVGAPKEKSNATGINGDQSNDLATDSGAAYVFARNGGTWSQQAYLKASNNGVNYEFGSTVAIADNTIVVGADGESSNATGVNGDQNNNLGPISGAAYVFVRTGETWSQQAYLKASNTDPYDLFGTAVAISGNVIVVGATSEDSNATGINGDQNDNSASFAGAAYVFVRSGGTWSQQAYLKASNTGAGDEFGAAVAISGDTVVVGAFDEDSAATGINSDQSDDTAGTSGAAYLFTFSPNTIPAITATGVTRQQGSPTSFAPIATVNDAEDDESTLAVTISSNGVNFGASAMLNGVTVSGILVDGSGNVTANVVAACGASNAAFTLQVTDSAGSTATATLNVNVSANTPPVLSYNTPQNVTVSGSLMVNPLNGPSDNGGLPTVGTATISPNTFTGTVAANGSGVVTINNAGPEGSYTVTVPVTDNCGVTTNAQFALNVTCPTITLGGLANGTAGTAYNQAISAQPNGSYSFTQTGGTLPPGLTLASNGNLSGTPTTTGSFTFTVKATLATASTCMQSQSYTVTITCPTISLNPATLPNGTAGAAYNQTVTATPAGGNYSYAVTSGALPPGLSLNSASGQISGTPTQPGNFNFRVTATGFGACSGFRDYQIVVPGCAPITIDQASLGNGQMGTAYSQALSVSPAGNYSFAVTNGALPPGLSLNAASGLISGTPSTSGSFSFRITASLNGCAGSRDYTVTIGCQVVTISPNSLPSGQASVNYFQQFNPGMGYTFSLVQGSLPAGLSLSSAGVLGGLPTVTGSYSFTIKATAAVGCSGTQAYTLVINCPTISLSPASLPNGTVGAAYSQTLSASPAGGNYSFSVSAGSLPSGFSLNPATGSLSGTPSVSGTFNFTITATGFGACAGSRAYTITIGGGGCPTIALPGSLSGGSVGATYSQSVAASPAGSYSYTVTAGSLPPGVTLYNNGLLFGYPTTSGTFSFTIKATDANGCTGTQAYTVQITNGAG